MKNKKFEFQKKGHKYFLDDRALTGVTTVLGVIAKPALIQWSANMTADYILKNGKVKDEDFILISKEEIKEARTAHLRTKEDAGQKGTDIHFEIEQIIKEAIEKTNGIIDGHNLNEEKQISNFTDWAIKNKVKFLESEKKMYSEKYWLGGTCDFTVIINGKKYVGDIKTGNSIYKEFFLQTAAYRMLCEEMGERGFVGSLIINIKKDGTFNEKEDVIFSEYYEDEKEAFLAALKLYRIMNNFELKK